MFEHPQNSKLMFLGMNMSSYNQDEVTFFPFLQCFNTTMVNI